MIVNRKPKKGDDIVVAIDGGKTAADFASTAQNKPHYVFIMEEGELGDRP